MGSDHRRTRRQLAVVEHIGPHLAVVGFCVKRLDQLILLGQSRFGVGKPLAHLLASRFKYVQSLLTLSVEPVEIEHIHHLQARHAGERQTQCDENIGKHYNLKFAEEM